MLEKGSKIRIYRIENSLSTENDTIFYMGENEVTGEKIKICEFYPSELCKREGNAVIPIEGAEQEFSLKLNRFRSMGDMVRTIDLNEVIKIREVISENNTCYVICEHLEAKSLSAYLLENGGKMDYKKAYEMISPLARSLNYLFNNGIFLRPQIENIIVLPGDMVRLQDFYMPQYDVNYCIEDLSNILYTMLTGKRYKDCLEKPSVNGAVLPLRLDETIFKALYANTAYSSIEEYFNEIKDSVLFDTTMAGTENKEIHSTVLESAKALQEETVPLDNTPQPNTQADSGIPESIPANPSEINSGVSFKEPGGEMPFGGRVVNPGGSLSGIAGNGLPRPDMYPQGPPTYQSYSPNNPPPYPMPGGYNPNYGYPPNPPKDNKKFIIGCASIGCFGLILVIAAFAFFALNIYRFAETAGTNLSRNYSNNYSYERDSDFNDSYSEYDDWESSFTLWQTNATVGMYEKVAYDNTVIEHDGYIYFRGFTDDWGLYRYPKGGNPFNAEMLKEGIMPQFMAASGGRIYYADALVDSHIYYIDIESGEAYPFVDTRTSFINVTNGAVYYINLEDDARLYRINEDSTDNMALNYSFSDSAVLAENSIIYVDDYGTVYKYNPETEEENFFCEAEAINIVYANKLIYLLDLYSSQIRCFDLDGNEIELNLNTEVYGFKVKDNLIYFADSEYYINIFNIETAEITKTEYEAVYIDFAGEEVYYYEYWDEDLYVLNGETGISEAVYSSPSYDSELYY